MHINPNFWQGKKVLITGHTGFKGSWLSIWLQYLQAEVMGLALFPNSEPNLFTCAHVGDNMQSAFVNIQNFNEVKEAITRFRPEIVIHMAAQSLVRYSYVNPVETYATNVMGTVHLLEAIRTFKNVKVVINVTTDKCYENKEWLWGYRENEELGGYDPYSNSKACSEFVTTAYRNAYFNLKNYEQHGVALASVRAGNVIGGGDWAQDRLIPDLMRACVTKTPLIIRNPMAIRPWQHVLEPLNGYLLLAQCLYESPLQFAEAWNFGPNENDAKPVNWIADTVIKLWGDNDVCWLLEENGTQPHEAKILKLDCTKAKEKLNWKPRWELERALQQVVEWHKAYSAREDMYEFTLEQIQAYY